MNSDWVLQQASHLANLADNQLFVWATVTQLLVAATLYVISRRTATHTTHWLDRKYNFSQHRSYIPLHVSNGEIVFLVFTAAFLWLGSAGLQGLEQPANLLLTLASLFSAWAVVRFSSSTIKSHFWSRLVAIILWTVAALNIVGWLAPAIEILDKASFTVSDVRISMLLVIKSLLAFALLMWTINFLSGTMKRSFSKARGLTPSQQVLFYKISNIVLYAIGFMVGLNIVGLDLTALTIFSGALGLGIGFGLQKVFSNLISGIILLLDKSVKPGDVIAIDGTYGWVNSLGARCVSVITRDGKEHLIPNENLITEQVENWSYSDKTIRIHIEVGVSYNSDMKKVRKLLFQAIQEQPRVLAHPKPNVLITGFGDSSVDHEIRLWMNDPTNGVGNLKSDIYYRIWELFQEHSVEIPFPQRDIHIKEQPALK